MFYWYFMWNTRCCTFQCTHFFLLTSKTIRLFYATQSWNLIGRQIDSTNRIHSVNELHGANLEEGNQHQENCQWKNQPNEPKYKPVKERSVSSRYNYVIMWYFIAWSQCFTIFYRNTPQKWQLVSVLKTSGKQSKGRYRMIGV